MAICCLLYVIASHDATYIYMPYITDINNFMKTKMGNKKKKKIETEFPTSTIFLFDIQITIYFYP